MGQEGREDYFAVEDCHGSVQTTLDPAINEDVASKTLEAVEEEVPGVEVVGGYLTGSSAYGLAVNGDALVNQINDQDRYGGSDIDLFVVVREGEEDNKDYISDSYDVIDDIGDHVEYVSGEINPIVIKEGKFLGAVRGARKDWEKGSDTEYVELPHPDGKRSHEYPEFIESLKKRVGIGSILSSPIEEELSMGEIMVDSYFRENGSKVKGYMRDQYDERKEILKENIEGGHLERAKHRSDEMVGPLGRVRSKTSLKNVLESEFELEHISDLAEGDFSNFELAERDEKVSGRQTQLSHYGSEGERYVSPSELEEDLDQFVDSILSQHPEVEVERTEKGPRYRINGQDMQNGFGSTELVRDTVNSIVGKAMSEVDVDFNPRDQELDELVQMLQERTEENQSTFEDWR
jgi:hypothetical protein